MNGQTTHNKVRKLTLSAMMMAIGLVLPFLTGQIPQIGSMLLPLHIPVLMCGLICGGSYGAAVGFILPLLRYVMFGMPPIFPTGLSMAFEMAAYGAIVGFLYSRSKWQCLKALYRCLILAMLGGRVVWGASQIVLLGLSGKAFTWPMFMAGAFLNAIPGILLQLVLIPTLMVALDKTGVVPFYKSPERAKA